MGKMGFWRGRRQDTSTTNLRSDTAEALHLLRNHEESGQGWFWSTDQTGRLTYLTDHVGKLLGVDTQSVIDADFAELFVQADDGSDRHRTLPFLFAKRSKFEQLTLRAVGAREVRWWSVSGRPYFDASGNFMGYRGSGFDITEQRKSSEHASQLALHDVLTGLPNRLRMSEVLKTSLMACEQMRRPCAVMLIDLDRFKQVNDTLGHPAGDALLKQVTDRLLRIVGDKEKVFRLGGDEFELILRDCDDRGQLGQLANEIIAGLSQPYSVEGSRCIIGASIGVAIGPLDGRTAEELIRNADLALYAAKGNGRGRFCFFSRELLQEAEDRRILEVDLRDALAKGQISLAYQPIVDTRTNCVTGVEALVRWQHPEYGWVSPSLFIPIAEEAGLIGPLGEWILRKACEDAASWPGKLRVAVNVSPVQFSNEALPKIVLSALATSGLAPARLELEITEGVFLSESAETDSMFTALKDIGVRLALDDFGTGYSSLGYLRTAPFDKIKIDQSFLREATLPGSRNGAIIAAIVALAEALDMETTAEGIESLDQLDLIRTLRVSHAQGYVYSKAVATDELAGRLESGDWVIPPAGPAKQRSARQSMYRKVGAIIGSYCQSILLRNLSDTGALVEGLVDLPVGAHFIIDFGDGQLTFARVRRALNQQHGVEFDQPLVNDGSGGFCTRHRVSPYLLGLAGLPTGTYPAESTLWNRGRESGVEALAERLGLRMAAASAQQARASVLPWLREDKGTPSDRANTVDTNGGPKRPALGDGDPRVGRQIPTIEQLSTLYLEQVKGDRKLHDVDVRYLRDHILPRYGSSRLDQIDQQDVSEWLAAMVGSNGYVTETATRIQALMSKMYLIAVHAGMPGADVSWLHGLMFFNPEREQANRLTQEEVTRLELAVHESHNNQFKSFVALLIHTGVRQRELLEARWDQVDLEAGVWIVPAQGADPARNIQLLAPAIDILRALPRWEDCPYLIANPKTRKPYRSFAVSWDTARIRAGLPSVEIEELRHTAVADTISSDELRQVAISRPTEPHAAE